MFTQADPRCGFRICFFGICPGLKHQLRQVFPEEVPLVHDLAFTHMKLPDSKHLLVEVIAKDVGVLVLCRCDALLLL